MCDRKIKKSNLLYVYTDDFLKQSKGLILLYSLKNPSFPEFIYTTESGVMSLDFHAEYPNLIAAGFYDGTVAVYNTAESTQTPKYFSSAKNGKHTDPVWQVRVENRASISISLVIG
jgi:dynein intermediate chain 1